MCFQVRESEDFYNLSKDQLLELILSDELEIEDEQVSVVTRGGLSCVCGVFFVVSSERADLCLEVIFHPNTNQTAECSSYSVGSHKLMLAGNLTHGRLCLTL